MMVIIISQDITRVVRNCAMCKKYRRERIEPMKGTEFPERPWSRVGLDFFQHKDKHYLLIREMLPRSLQYLAIGPWTLRFSSGHPFCTYCITVLSVSSFFNSERISSHTTESESLDS